MRRSTVTALVLCTLLSLGSAACTTIGSFAQAPVAASYGDDGVLLSVGPHPVLFYRTRAAAAEPWRVHYLHPVYAPDGRVLTEDAPPDHPHQRGVYWAWRRILFQGLPAADGWVGRDLTLQLSEPRFESLADGAGRLHTRAIWRVQQPQGTLDLIEESTTIDVSAPRPDEFQVVVEIRLRALRSGVELAGTDDDKGYGGFSVRLPEAERLDFMSDGVALQARVAAVETGAKVEFSWPGEARSSGLRVEMACAVDGRPWRQWVLRREPSMQNCAFPGRTPVAIPTDRPLHLSASLRLRAPAATPARPAP